MRRWLGLLAASLATAVAILVGGTSVAFAATCDPTNNPYQGGYAHVGNTLVGNSATAAIDDVNDTVYGGSVRGRIAVDTNYGASSLTVGIRNTGAGPKLFFELNGVTENTWAVNYSQFYTVSISHDSSSVYTAHWGSHSYTATLGPSGENETDFLASSSNPGSQCNVMDFQFHNVGPWGTSAMNGWSYLPYQLNTESDTAFEFYGP
jgi:hypothetical protein